MNVLGIAATMTPALVIVSAFFLLQWSSFACGGTSLRSLKPKESRILKESGISLNSSSTMRSTWMLELSLTKARSSIKNAGRRNNRKGSADSIYRNEAVFQRCYQEMEKRFKIYVYEEGSPPLFHYGPCISIYSTEGRFINQMDLLRSPLRTTDPDKAHIFFMPFSVTMLVAYVYKPKQVEMPQARKVVADYVRVLSSKYPYWNRSLGADHFMLSCHDWGPITSEADPFLYNTSIRVLCNANTSEGFNPVKDASLPEMNSMRNVRLRVYGGKPPDQRTFLAFFAGGDHGPVRPLLFQYWLNKDPDMKVFMRLPAGKDEFNTPYNEHMSKSKFCLCPSGYEVASPRIVEAIYSGCVPVVLSKGYYLPFSDVLRWDSFSVTVPVSEIPNLKSILLSISNERYLQLQRNVLRVQKHFKFSNPPTRQDMFYMLLHSVWLRRLNFRLPRDGEPTQ